MRQNGTVLKFNVNRGFGFIKTAAAQSLFFHINQVKDGYLLESGDVVSFVIKPSTTLAGKNECFEVELVERAAKAAL